MTINIFCYLNTWISRLYHVDVTIPFMIWVNDNFYIIFRLNNFFSGFFYNAQSLSVIVLAAHRLWASRSTSRSEVWGRSYGYVYAGLVIISGGLAYINVPLKLVNLEYYDHEKKAFVTDQLDPDKAALSNNIFLIKSVIFFSILVIVNIWTIYLVVKRFAHSLESSTMKTMMKNMTIIALINSSLFFLIMLMPMGIRVSGENYFYSSMITSDMLSLSLPYILLACDRNVQSTVSKIVKGWTTKKPLLQPRGSLSQRRPMVLSIT